MFLTTDSTERYTCLVKGKSLHFLNCRSASLDLFPARSLAKAYPAPTSGQSLYRCSNHNCEEPDCRCHIVVIDNGSCKERQPASFVWGLFSKLILEAQKDSVNWAGKRVDRCSGEARIMGHWRMAIYYKTGQQLS